MSSTTNSFLRGQRKTDLLELAQEVGLQKYVRFCYSVSAATLGNPAIITNGRHDGSVSTRQTARCAAFARDKTGDRCARQGQTLRVVHNCMLQNGLV